MRKDNRSVLFAVENTYMKIYEEYPDFFAVAQVFLEYQAKRIPVKVYVKATRANGTVRVPLDFHNLEHTRHDQTNVVDMHK